MRTIQPGEASPPGRDRSALLRVGLQSGAVVVGGALAYLVARESYLLFHVAVEGFAIVVAFLIYVLGSRASHRPDSFWSFLASAFFFIGILGLAHTITYRGMAILPAYGADVPTQLWLATRFLYTATMLAAPLMFTRRIRAAVPFWAFAAATLLLLGSIFGRVFPTAYVEGVGLTAFKVAAEYAVCIALGASIWLLRSRRHHLDRTSYRLLVASIAIGIVAELLFTLYTDVYGVTNFLGHLFQGLSYYCLYRAVVHSGIETPYQELKDLNTQLESRVSERTARLEAANEKLLREAQEREAAQAATQQLSRAVEQSPASVVITDVDGAIQYVNPKFTRLTGYTFDEALGQNPRILKTEVTDPEVYVSMWKAILAGDEWRGEFCNKKKNGELYWELASISPIRNAEGEITHFVAVKEDITERKRIEEEVNRLNTDLNRRAQELEAVNSELATFSYSVSHDLRAPLRRIDGFSQALLEDYEASLDSEGREYLGRIRASVHRMAQLIEDLLRLSRVTAAEMRRERVDLTALAETVASELRRGEPDRRVDFTLAPGLVAEGDSRLLQAALENLLGNAWKFTSRCETARIEFGAEEQDGETVFFVRDNGAGFDMKQAGRLFGTFQRLHTDSEFPGSGVGLATVQRIIHRHGGRIWATGHPNQGATFYFTLP